MTELNLLKRIEHSEKQFVFQNFDVETKQSPKGLVEKYTIKGICRPAALQCCVAVLHTRGVFTPSLNDIETICFNTYRKKPSLEWGRTFDFQRNPNCTGSQKKGEKQRYGQGAFKRVYDALYRMNDIDPKTYKCINQDTLKLIEKKLASKEKNKEKIEARQNDMFYKIDLKKKYIALDLESKIRKNRPITNKGISFPLFMHMTMGAKYSY